MQYDLFGEIGAGIDELNECLMHMRKISGSIKDSIVMGKGIVFDESKVCSALCKLKSTFESMKDKIGQGKDKSNCIISRGNSIRA